MTRDSSKANGYTLEDADLALANHQLDEPAQSLPLFSLLSFFSYTLYILLFPFRALPRPQQRGPRGNERTESAATAYPYVPRSFSLFSFSCVLLPTRRNGLLSGRTTFVIVKSFATFPHKLSILLYATVLQPLNYCGYISRTFLLSFSQLFTTSLNYTEENLVNDVVSINRNVKAEQPDPFYFKKLDQIFYKT